MRHDDARCRSCRSDEVEVTESGDWVIIECVDEDGCGETARVFTRAAQIDLT